MYIIDVLSHIMKRIFMRKLWDVRAAFDIKRLFLHGIIFSIYEHLGHSDAHLTRNDNEICVRNLEVIAGMPILEITALNAWSEMPSINRNIN